ncbi:MAG: hypothetical protein M5U28_37770 [Sandaracinaceae bacterium]|nr:hypothetical protein [Sandaracinaceae bacterium]
MISKKERSSWARGVNPRSRIAAFTLALLLWALPALAQADRVVLYPVAGTAAETRLAEIEERLATLLREQGHTVVAPTSATRPQSSGEMEAAASATNATYVVVAEVDPLRAQYRMHVHVYYRPSGRLEDLVATVLEAEEPERLSDILSSMVRREGLGEDALRLTGTEPADPGETDEERRRREEEERARLEEEERARREAEEAARQEAEEQARREREEAERRRREAQSAWDARPQYGADGHWMVQLQVGGGWATRLGSLPGAVQSDGGLFDVGARVGRTFDGLDGFELRGGIDVLMGSFAGPVTCTDPMGRPTRCADPADGVSSSVGFTGLAVHVGAAWLGSFLVEPLYVGLGGEVGVIFSLTGARDAGFSGRASALFAWRPVPHFVIEASIPEIGVLSPGSGVLSIGGGVRAGYRFD